MKVPAVFGVPLTVIVLPEKLAVTPPGSPVAAPIPVAAVVVKVITGEIGRLIQTIGLEEGAETAKFGLTVTVNVDVLEQEPLFAVTVY